MRPTRWFSSHGAECTTLPQQHAAQLYREFEDAYVDFLTAEEKRLIQMAEQNDIAKEAVLGTDPPARP